jgi:hypothetical protein
MSERGFAVEVMANGFVCAGAGAGAAVADCSFELVFKFGCAKPDVVVMNIPTSSTVMR